MIINIPVNLTYVMYTLGVIFFLFTVYLTNVAIISARKLIRESIFYGGNYENVILKERVVHKIPFQNFKFTIICILSPILGYIIFLYDCNGSLRQVRDLCRRNKDSIKRYTLWIEKYGNAKYKEYCNLMRIDPSKESINE